MILCKTLLFMTLGYVKKMYKNTMVGMGLQTIALCTLSLNISAPRQKSFEKMPWMLRCSVPDVPRYKTLLFMTLGYIKKKVYKYYGGNGSSHQ